MSFHGSENQLPWKLTLMSNNSVAACIFRNVDMSREDIVVGTPSDNPST